MANEGNLEEAMAYVETAKALLKKGDDASVREAVALLERAIGYGYGYAAYLRGMLSLLGKGVKMSEEDAHRIFTVGATLNDAKCSMALFDDFLFGRGTERDDKAAYEALRDAQGVGCGEAAFWLGVCEKEGCFMQRDLESAASHIATAARLNIAGAFDELDELIEEKGPRFVMADVDRLLSEAKKCLDCLYDEIAGARSTGRARVFVRSREKLGKRISDVEDIEACLASSARDAAWHRKFKEMYARCDAMEYALCEARDVIARFGR